ncbi:MAG TPA: hypothetical protein VKA36_01795 [Solirubrobacterales bacterium]|nr:hypothetical protein [Solirubrobacterales bacterium]
MEGSSREQRLRRFEADFRAAGLPLFDEDFSASTDVFNRAVPLLAFIFLGQMLGAIKLEWSFLANVAAVLAGLAILLTAAGLVNRWRGRPFGSVPEQVGTTELAAFVLLPALLPLIFGGQVENALWTVVANLAVLAVIYAVLAYGLPSILVWTAKRLYRQLLSSLMLLARAVPLLLIFALLAFVNTEMWQVFATVSDPGLIAIGVLFLSLGTAFLLARLPREVRELESEVGGDAPELTTPQRRNVGTVLFVSQAVQVLTVALTVAAFFIVFGAIAITPEAREAWIGSEGDVLLTVTLWGEQFQLTAELLKVAGGLAAFSGLYFAIAMLTDSTYREEFLEELTGEMRSVFRERAEYLRLRAAPAGTR